MSHLVVTRSSSGRDGDSAALLTPQGCLFWQPVLPSHSATPLGDRQLGSVNQQPGFRTTQTQPLFASEAAPVQFFMLLADTKLLGTVSLQLGSLLF